MSVAQELGLSQTEYSEALLLQRVYQLVNQQLKVLCPQCQIAPITHLDHLNTEFYCTRCATTANKSSTKKIGNHKLTTRLVEELEIKYLTPTIHRRTQPMTPDVLRPDDDFNVWADWPSNKLDAPREQRSGGMLSNVEDNFSATDFPGMMGVLRRAERAPAGDAEVKENFTKRQPSEPTASEMMAMLQLIVENQKSLATSIMRLHKRLEDRGGAAQVVPHTPPSEPPPVFLIRHTSRKNKTSEEGVDSSNSTTDWLRTKAVRHRNKDSTFERETEAETRAAVSILERGGAKIDTRLIKSSVSRSQSTAYGAKPLSTQSTSIVPDRTKNKKNPFRDNPFT